MSVRRWKETGKLPVFLEHREGSFVLHSDYAELEKAAGEMAESIRGLMPHCDEPKMDGETGFERAWIRARTALAAFDKAKEGRGMWEDAHTENQWPSGRKKIVAEQGNIPDAECAKCGKSVLVRDGEDWEEGDLCDHCNGDRVKELEAEVAQLKADNLRLKAPVSDAESRAAGWTSCGQNFEQLRRREVDALLTARTQEGDNGK